MPDKPTIEAAENGPLLVKGLEDLQNSKGEPIATRNVMALCRCGGSNTKPFCDGTHSKNGFTDAKEEGRQPDKVDEYRGKQITIHDNRAICAHAGACTDGLPHVWRMKTEPWIDPDGDGNAEIINTIKQCPSGALSATIEGEIYQDEDRSPAIQVSQNAPYVVTGGIELIDIEWGAGTSKEHFTLCRCGQSKNKPFCDGSHWSAEFTDDQTDTLKTS